MSSTSLLPTRKVIAMVLVGVLTVVGHAIASGGFDATEYGELVTLGIAFVGAWLTPESPTNNVTPK